MSPFPLKTPNQTLPAASASAGVLLVNLGTPNAPTASAVRRYLAEFLGDRRVIDTPRWLWWPILYGIILRFRPRISARAYASVWTSEGSPLMVFSRALAQRLREELKSSGRIETGLAMSYGSPSIAQQIAELNASGVRRLLVLPLYPQYSATTTGAVFDAVAGVLRGMRWLPELRFINDYHDDPLYISALARQVELYWSEHGHSQKLLLSFHGLPQRYVNAGDPYYAQCIATARLLGEHLGLGADRLSVAFQSRVGREPWLRPYTDEVLEGMPKDGTRHIQVLCPGFAVDCLETLEEVAIRYREQFIKAGGERLDYIPALNADSVHVDVLRSLIARHSQGWPEFRSLAEG